MSRRRFIGGVVLAMTPLDATASAQEYKAQQAGKVYRIATLSGRSPGADSAPIISAVHQELKGSGMSKVVTSCTKIVSPKAQSSDSLNLPKISSVRMSMSLSRMAPRRR
jgi:hypothetical protein